MSRGGGEGTAGIEKGGYGWVAWVFFLISFILVVGVVW